MPDTTRGKKLKTGDKVVVKGHFFGQITELVGDKDHRSAAVLWVRSDAVFLDGRTPQQVAESCDLTRLDRTGLVFGVYPLAEIARLESADSQETSG